MKLSEELEMLATAVLSHVENSRCAAASVKLENIAERLEELSEDARDAVIGWISVDDRLPDDAQLVLFRLRNKAKTEKGIHLAGCKTFETEYCCDRYDYEEVTHWMPLPPAPEAKQ